MAAPSFKETLWGNGTTSIYFDYTVYGIKNPALGQGGLCQVLVGKFPYLFLLSLFFYFFVSQISPGYALNRYFSLVAKYKIS